MADTNYVSVFNAAACGPCKQLVAPRSIDEIAEFFRLNADANSKITVIGGGHSTLCTRPDATVMDLRQAFNPVKVSKIQSEEDGAVVDVYVDFGGGATLGDLMNALKGSGWSVPVGTYGTVGAGLVLQGGNGLLTRQHGLTIDAIKEATLVDATGKIHKVSSAEDQNLFWALKGAGNQIGGVITNIRLQAVPIEMMQVDRVLLKVNATELEAHLVQAWKLAVELPGTDTLSILTRKAGNNFLFMLMHSSTKKDAGKGFFTDNHLVESLDDGRILLHESQQISYHDTDSMFGIPEPFASENIVDFEGGPPFAAIHTAFIGGKNFLPSSSALAKALVQRLSQAPTCNGKVVGHIDFQHTGGKMKDADPTETAFWNRDQEFSCVIQCFYAKSQVGGAGERQAFEWVDSVEAVLRETVPVKVGTYSVDVMRQSQGFSKLNTESLLLESYGDNWERIQRVRQRLDPKGVLRPHDL